MIFSFNFSLIFSTVFDDLPDYHDSRFELRHHTCPEPRVKRAFPKTLSASPVFTGFSREPARKRPIDAGWRPMIIPGFAPASVRGRFARDVQGARRCHPSPAQPNKGVRRAAQVRAVSGFNISHRTALEGAVCVRASIRHPPSAIRHPPSTIRHLPSAFCLLRFGPAERV